MASLFVQDDRVATKAPAVTDPARAARLRVLITWAMLAVTMVLVNFKLVAAMRFGDPDDALRLLQVRDLLAGQS
jgi:hypothetical protein